MPTTLIPGGTTGFLASTSDTTFLLPVGTTLSNTSSSALISNVTTNIAFQIDGTLLSTNSVGFEAFTSEITVHIRPTGSVTGTFGALFGGDDVIFRNDGQITGTQPDGQQASGLAISSNNFSGLNTGMISGELNGITLLPSTDNVQFINTGAIAANVLRGIVIATDANASSIFVNSGLIRGTIEGYDSSFAEATGTHTLINSGSINATAGPRAFNGGNSTNIVINSGTMQGNVSLDGGADFFNNRDGTVNGTIFGEGGADTIWGGSGDENLNGGAGNDNISGGAGADLISGAGNDDFLHGEQGDDTIRGGGGNDIMLGGQGVDLLNGFGGDDTLDGGQGNDTLIGGLGADTFQFQRIAGNDRIFGWQNGTDQIDLTAYETDFAAVNAAISSAGTNAIIDLTALGGNGSITLNGAAGTLDATDFLL